MSVVADAAELSERLYPQAVVHLQKSRDATWSALAQAWSRLEPGGHLLLCGGNELGVKSAVRRLEEELGQRAAIVANRARGRVAFFRRDEGPGPRPAEALPLWLEDGEERLGLRSAVGVFSAREIDPGTLLLVERLSSLAGAGRVFDPGCGIGVLGLVALRRFATATAVLADADWRAVACARANARALGLADRCQVVWWDAVGEPPPLDHCDLALVNPPFHAGKTVDLAPAQAMFRAVDQVLSRGGQALVVANRSLPYERHLRLLGELEEVRVRSGFKLLSVLR
jgi:16S rRNA (guanine1207-N2)-methyltransferase